MSKPRLLDLFCGGGGCSVGYHRAGFDIVGVDKNPQPEYPFEFHLADALTFPLSGFDAIHASPPCQAYSSLQHLGKRDGKERFELVEPIRDRLRAAGVPYVIENVPGAPLINAIELCGQHFGLLVRRHRLFECSFSAWSPNCRPHHTPFPVAVYGDHPDRTIGARLANAKYNINRAETLKHGQEAMGIDWMPWRPLTQAIPPAYTEFLGKQLLEHLGRAPHE